MNQTLHSSNSLADIRRQRILVVDDHELGRRSLCRLLEATGYDVTAVKDGRTALESMKTSIVPDYVLTDLRLPDIDGREIVQAARSLVPRPWIAFITGWDLDDDESRRIGLDWVFLKPLDISEIVAKLQEASISGIPVPDGIANLDPGGCSSS
jgi:CheY-like chemotaxis protein